MADWCFDTSGLSNPYGAMPEDIHQTLWRRIREFLASGHVAVTKEIFDEMLLIDGGLGDYIGGIKDTVLREVNNDGWDWRQYIGHTKRTQGAYRQFISEFNLGVRSTIGLNDLSIICLAKTLGWPVVSMEKTTRDSPNKRRIPDICELEGVRHCTFSDFLRGEGIRV